MSIKSAAIRDKNGKVYVGECHGTIRQIMPPELFADSEDGFVTDSGYFADRIEAAKIAFACKQTAEYVGSLRSIHINFNR